MVDDLQLAKLIFNTDPSLFLDVWPLKLLIWEDEKGKIFAGFHRLEFHFERRKLNTNSKAYLQLKSMQSKILKGVKSDFQNLPSKDLPS